MIGEARVLAIVPARAGSKGVPRKNVRLLAGKPLLAWTLEAAAAARTIDRVVLSSNDEEAIVIATDLGCDVPFRRPAELATDEARAAEVVLHALDAVGEGYDYVVYLQPTSPLRAASDVDAAIELCHSHGAPCCVSVTESAVRPEWLYALSTDGELEPVTGFDTRRRQDLRQVYRLNGAVYVARVDWFRDHQSFLGAQTLAHVMPEERSVDVDTELDLMLAGLLLERR